MTARLGAVGKGAMARNLRDFLLETYLPDIFCPVMATEDELRVALRDACLYHRSDKGRLDVEVSRLSHIIPRCAAPSPECS